MSEDVLLPVILCGGSGTRLWPLSRESFPKQYLSIDEKEKILFTKNSVETKWIEKY